MEMHYVMNTSKGKRRQTIPCKANHQKYYLQQWSKTKKKGKGLYVSRQFLSLSASCLGNFLGYTPSIAQLLINKFQCVPVCPCPHLGAEAPSSLQPCMLSTAAAAAPSLPGFHSHTDMPKSRSALRKYRNIGNYPEGRCSGNGTPGVLHVPGRPLIPNIPTSLSWTTQLFPSIIPKLFSGKSWETITDFKSPS